MECDRGASPVKAAPLLAAAPGRALALPPTIAEEIMARLALATLFLLASLAAAQAADAPTRFWNLTPLKLTGFYLAPAGTQNWGKNQCENDRDLRVDPDERLRITDVASGSFDAKLVADSGKQCFARNVKIERGTIFSIEERDITCP
jgi:hypothetical protein